VALVLVTVRDLVDGDVHIGHDLPHACSSRESGWCGCFATVGAGPPLRGEEDLARQPARPGTRGTSRERYLIRRW
jgi:hypothetical protein